MRNTRLIWQLYPSHLFITLAALLAFVWFGTYSLRSFQLHQTATGLEARAHLVEGNVLKLLASSDTGELIAFCREAGKKSGTRLTVIAPDGTVLADSNANPAALENHGDRPEIIAALRGKIDPALRFSHTLQADFMYVAIPLVDDSGKRIGALRTAVPVTAIDKTLRNIHRQMAWSLLLVALLAALIAWFIARRISKPLEEMKRGAERFADGEFNRKLKVEGSEEVAGLARAMNEMADQLDARIKTIVRQHNELQTVFSSMVEGVITIDSEERIVDINPAGAQFLNADPEKIRGKSIQVGLRNSQLQSLALKALAGAEAIEQELAFPGEDGNDRFYLAHATRLADGAGALLVLNDVTQLRRLESIRRDFVANVSHELKTPITSIDGFAETLLDGALDEPEDARRFVEIIAQQAKRLHAIIEDLLLLSRMEQEAKKHEPVMLSERPLAEMLEAAIRSTSRQADDKKMPITLICPKELTVRVNPILFEQALVNLLDNALKYGNKGGMVWVEAEKRDDEILIRVRDNGMGIARQDISRIFERFYRVDKARSTKTGGTGLGLSIVRHIVQAHQGHVTVESNLGQGSTFSIHLPV